MLDNPDANALSLQDLIPGSVERAMQAQEEAPAPAIGGMAPPSDENLAARLADSDRAQLVALLDQEIKQAEDSRKSLLEIQRKGIDRLGIDRTIESRSDPFDGASAVVHPALMQAALDFQSMAMRELAPLTGPARETPQDEGELGEAQARCGQAVNVVYTRHIPEWRSEFDRLLMMLPLEGSAFLKTWWGQDGAEARPRQAYVPCDQVIIPYNDTGDPRTMPFIGHRLFLHRSEIDANVASGMWLEHAPMVTTDRPSSEVRDKVDQATGTEPRQDSQVAGQFNYIEVSVYTSVPALFAGQPRQYLATYEEATQKLVALRLNEDEAGRRRAQWTHYRMFPWRGAYGLGLLHVIGGLTDAATGALRALLDSAHIANVPGGLALGGSAIKDTAIDAQPLQFTRVDAPPNVKDIRELVMPFPFPGPSTVLYELLGFLGGAAKEFASISMQRLAEANPNMPVGTTLALVEEGAKVYSAIHERLFDARRGELEIVRGYARLMLDEIAPYVEDFTPADLSDEVPVWPVSSPQAPSQMHRIAKAQAALDLAGKAASVGVQPDMRAAILEAGGAMGIPNLDRLFPDPPDPVNADPFSETVVALKGGPIALGPMDDHIEHVRAHCAVAVLPGVGQSPGGQQLIIHAFEHAAEAAKAAGMMEVDPLQVWTTLVEMIAPALQPPDPTQGLIEVERAKVEARKEEIAAKTAADIRMTREEMQADITVEREKLALKKDELLAEYTTKVRLAREANASQERIAAARIQGTRAAAKERAALLPPPGAKKGSGA